MPQIHWTVSEFEELIEIDGQQEAAKEEQQLQATCHRKSRQKVKGFHNRRQARTMAINLPRGVVTTETVKIIIYISCLLNRFRSQDWHWVLVGQLLLEKVRRGRWCRYKVSVVRSLPTAGEVLSSSLREIGFTRRSRPDFSSSKSIMLGYLFITGFN